MTPRKAAVAADEFDFDALLAEKRLEPIPLKLGGKTYQLRRDLTARERNEASRLILQTPGSEGDVEGAAILLGHAREDGTYDTADAEQFTRFAASLPHDVETEVWERVLVAARLAVRKADESKDGDAGEFPASSPA